MGMKQAGQGGSGPPREPDPEVQPSDPDDSQSAASPGEAGPEERAGSAALPGDAGLEDPEAAEGLPDRSPFPHPQWMVGVVLIFAVLVIAGGLGNPLWLLVGSPFILVLVVYIWVKLASRSKGDGS